VVFIPGVSTPFTEREWGISPKRAAGRLRTKLEKDPPAHTGESCIKTKNPGGKGLRGSVITVM
jgi:hypothetical protein